MVLVGAVNVQKVGDHLLHTSNTISTTNTIEVAKQLFKFNPQIFVNKYIITKNYVGSSLRVI